MTARPRARPPPPPPWPLKVTSRLEMCMWPRPGMETETASRAPYSPILPMSSRKPTRAASLFTPAAMARPAQLTSAERNCLRQVRCVSMVWCGLDRAQHSTAQHRQSVDTYILNYGLCSTESMLAHKCVGNYKTWVAIWALREASKLRYIGSLLVVVVGAKVPNTM